MKLFMYVAMLDGSLFWYYFIEPYFCAMNYPLGIWYSTFHFRAPTQQQELDMYIVLSESVQFFNTFTWCASMQINICICIDLVLMIKHPFEKKGKRMAKYYLSAMFVGILSGLEKAYMDWFTENLQ
jgi:hypothetical protein